MRHTGCARGGVRACEPGGAWRHRPSHSISGRASGAGRGGAGPSKSGVRSEAPSVVRSATNGVVAVVAHALPVWPGAVACRGCAAPATRALAPGPTTRAYLHSDRHDKRICHGKRVGDTTF